MNLNFRISENKKCTQTDKLHNIQAPLKQVNIGGGGWRGWGGVVDGGGVGLLIHHSSG